MRQTTALDCPDYIVRVSSAHMPNSCWGRYVHVAVLEVDPGVTHSPAIDDRIRGVRRVVWYAPKCHVGSTARSASECAIAAAEAYAEKARRVAWRKYLEAVDAAVSASLALREDEI